jgi:MinD superfamily P-loop ATPase
VWVQAYDDTGKLVHDCDVDTGDFHMVTGVREHAGRVWMGSLHERGVAVLDR